MSKPKGWLAYKWDAETETAHWLLADGKTVVTSAAPLTLLVQSYEELRASYWENMKPWLLSEQLDEVSQSRFAA